MVDHDLALFKAPYNPPFYVLTDVTALFLGQTAQDCNQDFSGAVQRIDIFVLEEDPHPRRKQTAGIPDGVQRVSGKTGDLFGDDKVKEPLFPPFTIWWKFPRFLVAAADKPSSM